MRSTLFLWVLLLGMLSTFQISAQHFNIHNPITLPDKSQETTITQRIGYTDVTLNYHSPAAKGRDIWGALLPFGQVWRAGANENTLISITHDAKINGQNLPKGSYGLHLLPEENQWTFIFSKNHTSWGSYFYDPEEDALRVTVPVEAAPEFREWMAFEFHKKNRGTTTVVLTWADKRARFAIDLDIDSIAIDHIRKQLKSDAYWEWFSWCQAADYCVQYDINTEEALQWINRSIELKETFYNLDVKAKLLRKKGEESASEKLMARAVEVGSAVDLDRYGRRLRAQENGEAAIAVFKKAVAKDPTYWRPYYNLGKMLKSEDNSKEAKKMLKKALEHAPEANKNLIQSEIDTL